MRNAGIVILAAFLATGLAASGTVVAVACLYAYADDCPDGIGPLPVRPYPRPEPRPHPHPGPRPRLQLWVAERNGCEWCQRQEAALRQLDLSGYEVRRQNAGDGPVARVSSYPTLAVFKDGFEVQRHAGYLDARQLQQWLAACPHAGPPQEDAGDTSQVAGPSFGGEELAVDLPGAEQAPLKNIGSRIDGLGMCVFSSAELAFLSQGLEQMRGFRNWCAEHYPGGGDPPKLDKLIHAFCRAKGVEVPLYVQYEGPDPGPILALADKTRRMACFTYGYSPRYHNQTIYHMVCGPKFSGRYGVVLDNNFVGSEKREDVYEWMPLAEQVKRVVHVGGKGWVFICLAGAIPEPIFN